MFKITNCNVKKPHCFLSEKYDQPVSDRLILMILFNIVLCFRKKKRLEENCRLETIDTKSCTIF